MATIILSAYKAIPSTGGRFSVSFDIGGREAPALADRRVEIKNTAHALAELEAYRVEAEATGKPLAVSIRLANGSRSPNGFKAATSKSFHPVNLGA